MLHLVDNKTKKAVRSPRTQTLNPDGLITSSSKSSNSFSAYNLPQSDTVVNTHSMVNMKKSLLPKDRQKSLPTRPAPPRRKGGGSVMGGNRLLCSFCVVYMQKYRKKQQDLQRLKMLKTRINKGKTSISAGL